MSFPKNYVLRDAIYDLVCEGILQSKMIDSLKKKGFNIKKSRLSQLLKELQMNEYIICTIKTVFKLYAPTRKSYPYKSRSLQTSQSECNKKLRIHNQFFKYKIISKSNITNDAKLWDRIIPMRNGVIQYIYYGHDIIGRGLTVQRFEGKRRDTLVIKIPDFDWDYNKLDDFDMFILDKLTRAEHGIMHHFKLQMQYIGQTKTSYGIRPAPYHELRQEFLHNNYEIGDLRGDSSKGNIPELETDSRRKAIAIMEFLNLAESELLPSLLDILKQMKDLGISPKTMIDVMGNKREQDRLTEMENLERGVV